jgi:glycosyltransferase involved in cell wall biosynthesis
VKLAILSQYYPPEVGAPQARLSGLAREFVRRGHAVTVLTAMPNYPTGKIQPGYHGLLRREEHDGMSVIRTPIYPTQSPGFVRRLASYFSFMLSSAAVGTACLGSPHYLLVESPPLFLGLTGLWLSRLKRARMVFNVSDLWPESAVRLGILRAGSATHSLSAGLESFLYRHAWLVTGQSREIVSDISARFPACETFHLPNAVDTETFHPERATKAASALLGNGETCRALYAGLHGLAQGLSQVLDAAEGLPTDCDLRFVLMGDGPEKGRLVAQARERRIERVRFLDPRPHGEMPAVLAAADILIVPLLRELPGAVPSKLYEAMASGRPVILVARGEAARIVENHRAGLVVAPGDLGGLVNACRILVADEALRRRLGANGRAAAVQHYDRTRSTARFIDLLEQRL